MATNVFSAGQETTVRLLSTAFKAIGDYPDVQAGLRADRSLLPNFIEECLRFEAPVKDDFRLSRVPLPSVTPLSVLGPRSWSQRGGKS